MSRSALLIVVAGSNLEGGNSVSGLFHCIVPFHYKPSAAGLTCVMRMLSSRKMRAPVTLMAVTDCPATFSMPFIASVISFMHAALVAPSDGDSIMMQRMVMERKTSLEAEKCNVAIADGLTNNWWNGLLRLLDLPRRKV